MTRMTMPDGYRPDRWQRHTVYSDPGRYADLVDRLATDDAAVSAVARNLIVHYRASSYDLPATSKDDINARWVQAILAHDQSRHPGDLTADRDEPTRVQGCCRDHSLFSAAVLRQHHLPARIRYGFAGYFVDDFHVDHVVVEVWDPDGNRWRRFDPEIEKPMPGLPTPQDIPAGLGAPYETAAEVWQAYRAGSIDADTYGVGPDVPIEGPWYIHNAAILDAAFRAGHELLLWDVWGPMSLPDGPTDQQATLVDELAALVVAADDGDVDAENALIDRMRNDERLAPGPVIDTIDPFGGPLSRTDLTDLTDLAARADASRSAAGS